MKLFSEYLMEAEQHKSGTYAALLLKNESRTKLYAWMEEHNIARKIPAKEYHCTVVYSTTPVPNVSDISINFPIKAKFKEWKIFGDDKLLVAVLTCPKAVKLFKETIKMGAKSDYPTFIPHISVAKNFKGDVPADIPDFEIIFYKFKSDSLDTDFKYNDNDS